jgi:crotonobetainyl-CoA:carnitine CoA-transferase CaiB-like acyl-CoA transferase
MVLEFDHPDLGTIRQLASPIKISGTNPDHRLGPSLGQQTEQVLRVYANATDQEITAWRNQGVV